jgi:nucleotide-binding universal stress UspA family protein
MEALLARSSVPVFVVYARPGQVPPPPFTPTNARVLVPQNGSEYDAPTLRAAMDMLGPGGEIILVTIAPTPEHVVADDSGRHVVAYLDQQEEALTREARDYLAGVAAPLRSGPTPIHVTTDVRVGDPANGIAMAALDKHADLVVMATHGRTGIKRAVLGSVAGAVLRTVATPVVLVHPGVPPPAEVGIERPVSAQLGPVPTL